MRSPEGVPGHPAHAEALGRGLQDAFVQVGDRVWPSRPIGEHRITGAGELACHLDFLQGFNDDHRKRHNTLAGFGFYRTILTSKVVLDRKSTRLNSSHLVISY